MKSAANLRQSAANHRQSTANLVQSTANLRRGRISPPPLWHQPPAPPPPVLGMGPGTQMQHSQPAGAPAISPPPSMGLQASQPGLLYASWPTPLSVPPPRQAPPRGQAWLEATWV